MKEIKFCTCELLALYERSRSGVEPSDPPGWNNVFKPEEGAEFCQICGLEIAGTFLGVK